MAGCGQCWQAGFSSGMSCADPADPSDALQNDVVEQIDVVEGEVDTVEDVVDDVAEDFVDTTDVEELSDL